MEFKGTIGSMTYSPSRSIVKEGEKFEVVKFEAFSTNSSRTTCVIEFSKNQHVAVTKWVSPKRTRSYPFSRLYEIYHMGTKRVALIPIIKDEGKGEGKNKSNNDRINFTTLSWMNLMNVYVILCWYDSAEAKSSTRITNQRLNDEHVRTELQKINDYQFDAHHWNQRHFEEDFIHVLDQAIASYQRIGAELGVEMHDVRGHQRFRESVIDDRVPGGARLSLDKIRATSVRASTAARNRESLVQHVDEDLSDESEKAVFDLRNRLGGIYPITCDEVFVNESSQVVLIRESKNSSKDSLPSKDDIYDGLFKLLLFRHVLTLQKSNVTYAVSVELRLTGLLNSTLRIPCEPLALETFISANPFKKEEIPLLRRAIEEAANNGIGIVLEPNQMSRIDDPKASSGRLKLSIGLRDGLSKSPVVLSKLFKSLSKKRNP